MEQVRELMSRLQSLELENDRLRVEASRQPTPVVQPANTFGMQSVLAPGKVIPRPDKYDGDRKKNKVKEFERKMRRYLRCMPDVDRALHVDIISGFLTGPADTWFHRWSQSQLNPDAEQLLSDLVSHFCPANVSQEARRKISVLQQRTSVDEYSSKFRLLMEEIDGITEAEAKTYFINGLKDAIRKEVLLKDLYGEVSLDEMEQMAVQIDAIIFRSRGQFKGYVSSRSNTNGISPMEGVQYNALSFEEKSRLRREGRCYHCREQKSHASGCRSNFVFRSNNLKMDEEHNKERAQDESDHSD